MTVAGKWINPPSFYVNLGRQAGVAMLAHKPALASRDLERAVLIMAGETVSNKLLAHQLFRNAYLKAQGHTLARRNPLGLGAALMVLNPSGEKWYSTFERHTRDWLITLYENEDGSRSKFALHIYAPGVDFDDKTFWPNDAIHGEYGMALFDLIAKDLYAKEYDKVVRQWKKGSYQFDAEIVAATRRSVEREIRGNPRSPRFAKLSNKQLERIWYKLDKRLSEMGGGAYGHDWPTLEASRPGLAHDLRAVIEEMSSRGLIEGNPSGSALYVGVNREGRGEVFRSAQTPTESSHGNRYAYVVGPFRTRLAADLMAEFGRKAAIHYQHVSDAEAFAQQYRRRGLGTIQEVLADTHVNPGNPSGPKCFVCGQPVNKRKHHGYFTMGARTIYMHPACDPEGKHQDKLMSAWEKKHPEAKARESPVENPSAAWHRKEMEESNNLSAYYHREGMLKARDRQRGETAAHRQSAFIAEETGRSYHEIEARLTKEAGPRVAAPEDTRFPREYSAGYLAAHLHSAEEARGRGNPSTEPITRVVFRRWRKAPGTLIALFPDDRETEPGIVGSYEHIGQHGAANYRMMIKATVPVTLKDLPDIQRLREELEGLGYNLRAYSAKEIPKVNPSPVEGAHLKRLAGSPEASYRAFHQVNVDKRSKVKVPEGWPRKLWYLGALVSLLTDDHRRISGGKVAVAGDGKHLFILGSETRLTACRVEEIQYHPPAKSKRAGAIYVHKFDNPPYLYNRGGGNYEIAGQGLKLTRRGIVG